MDPGCSVNFPSNCLVKPLGLTLRAGVGGVASGEGIEGAQHERPDPQKMHAIIFELKHPKLREGYRIEWMRMPIFNFLQELSAV